MSSVISVVEKYKGIFDSQQKFTFSGNRPTFGKKGEVNRFFVFRLCHDKAIFLDFLREVGLLRSEMVCNTCNSKMKIRPKNSKSDGFTFICNKACTKEKSIRFGSMFSCSKLKMEEIFCLLYEFIVGTTTGEIAREFGFGSHTLSVWRQFVNEQILNFVELSSEKIGGIDKIVEMDEAKLGKRKFLNQQSMDGQWVFGGVERESGKLFLADIGDRSPATLVKVIKQWIQPGTVIYSDCWNAYDSLGEEGYQNLTVNHSLTFANHGTGKTTLQACNLQVDAQFLLAVYLFQVSCEKKEINAFNHFLEIVRNQNWEDFKFSIK